MFASKKTKQYIFIMLAVVAFNMIFAGLFSDAPFYISTRTIILGMWCLMWLHSIRKRIIYDNIRHNFIRIVALMLLMCLAKAVKDDFSFGQPTLHRYAWYTLYLAFVLAPMICFMTSLSLGDKVEEKKFKKRYLLWIPAILILAMTFTNDLHLQCINFYDGLENVGTYKFGWVYYAVVLWHIVLYFTTVIVVFLKCRVTENRKYIWMPLVPLWASGGFFIGYLIFGQMPIIGGNPILTVSEGFIYMTILFTECIIQAGLVPCNEGYDTFFKQSHIAAQIVDNEGNVVIKTNNQLEENNPSMVIRSSEIQGGQVIWSEDLTRVEQIRQLLTDVNEQLINEETILKENLELKKNQAVLEVYNKIYDAIPKAVEKQLTELKELLNAEYETEEEFKKALGRACVLNAYVKRRSNLMIITDGVSKIPMEEIFLSIRESMENLRVNGVKCDVSLKSDGECPSEVAFKIYDFLEGLVEEIWSSIKTFYCILDSDEDSVMVRLVFNEGVPFVNDVPSGCKMSRIDEDGETNISLTFQKGGDFNA